MKRSVDVVRDEEETSAEPTAERVIAGAALSWEQTQERRCWFRQCAIHVGTLAHCDDLWAADAGSSNKDFNGCSSAGLDACFEDAISMQLVGDDIAACERRARALLEETCFSGHAASCGALGEHWHFHTGSLVDWRLRAQAECYFELACDDGLVESCLGYLRAPRANFHVRRDMEFAERACAAGRAEGCEDLALAWEHGRWSDAGRDLVKARLYYGKACEGGLERACYWLGIMWRDGQGGPADAAQARKYFERLCRYGRQHAEACEALIGLGIAEKDPI